MSTKCSLPLCPSYNVCDDTIECANNPKENEEESKSKTIKDYSIEELITWRNTASKRVSKIDEDLLYLKRSMEDSLRKFDKLERRRQKDVTWIVSLNRILYKKVIKDRS